MISAGTLDTPLYACWQPGADQYEDSDPRGFSLRRLPLKPESCQGIRFLAFDRSRTDKKEV